MIWLTKAKSYLGLSEVPGKKHNLKILEWWKAIRATFMDDETPWCAGFVGGVLEECGIKSSRSASARSYLSWGVRISDPCEGCIVVFWRGAPSGWSGHVGFVVGRDDMGNLMVLGGNQGDQVSIQGFSNMRVLDFRWPKGVPVSAKIGYYTLPAIERISPLSKNEA